MSVRTVDGERLAQVLLHHWGYAEFRAFQREAVEAVLAGRDALVVLPTGGGKSLCYQMPAACGIGLVLVVSPLIALMDDQVAAAREIGLAAGALHSGSPAAVRRQTYARLHAGDLQLLYASPERLVASDLLETVRGRLALVAVDEAHCVSHWGHEFRPEYRQLGPLFAGFPEVPRLALTATATPTVQDDIRVQLGLRDPVFLLGHPDRPNLVYRAFPRYDQARQVMEVVRSHPGEGGIVYAQTRREVDRLAKTLAQAGVSCGAYHAGLDAKTRAKVQEDFVNERLEVVVATIAFGMGIDRSNVRYVVHANTPRSIEHYQQESGRAGRDGDPAECVLFFSFGDLVTHRALSLREEGITPERRRVIERQLKEIGRYGVSPVCRHRLLAEHFGHPFPPPASGDAPGLPLQARKTVGGSVDPGRDGGDPAIPTRDAPQGCGACDVCLGETEPLPPAEALLISQKIISAVFRTESRFGAGYVIRVLLGRSDDRIMANRHDQLRVFGLMQEVSETSLRAWIDQLVVQGFLAVTEAEYPLLQVTRAGFELCKGVGTVHLGRPVPVARKRKGGRREHPLTGPGAGQPLDAAGAGLFENLRRLRLLLARKQGVPPYMVFPDSVLTSLAALRPTDPARLAGIKGIGEVKQARYGPAFLRVVAGASPEEVAEAFRGGGAG